MSVLKQVTNIQNIFHFITASLVKLPNSVIWFWKVFAVDSVPCMLLKVKVIYFEFKINNKNVGRESQGTQTISKH